MMQLGGQFLAVGLALAACGKPQPNPGTERGPCYGNGTCNAGLSCLSGLCVMAETGSPTSAAPSPPMADACDALFKRLSECGKLLAPDEKADLERTIDRSKREAERDRGKVTEQCAIRLREITFKGCDAVVVPVKMRHTPKAKTTEAIINVKKIYDGARSYYEFEANAGGRISSIARQFPRTPAYPGPVPPLGTCCKSPGGQCAPEPKLWTDPVWQALKFSVDDPHYYSYEYRSTGTAFTVIAYGDLNCDGVYSTFEMIGSIGIDGTISGSADIMKDRELE
jgi:hypothetical protein